MGELPWPGSFWNCKLCSDVLSCAEQHSHRWDPCPRPWHLPGMLMGTQVRSLPRVPFRPSKILARLACMCSPTVQPELLTCEWELRALCDEDRGDSSKGSSFVFLTLYYELSRKVWSLFLRQKLWGEQQEEWCFFCKWIPQSIDILGYDFQTSLIRSSTVPVTWGSWRLCPTNALKALSSKIHFLY